MFEFVAQLVRFLWHVILLMVGFAAGTFSYSMHGCTADWCEHCRHIRDIWAEKLHAEDKRLMREEREMIDSGRLLPREPLDVPPEPNPEWFK